MAETLVPIRNALGDAYLGDTKAANALFSSPSTFDERIISLLVGLGQGIETPLPSAISGDDLKAFLAAFGDTQPLRLAEVARLRAPFVPSSGTFVFDDFVTYQALSACTVYFTVCEFAPSSFAFNCKVHISGARPGLLPADTSINIRQFLYTSRPSNQGLVERFFLSLFSRTSSVVYSSESTVDIYSVSGGAPTVLPARNKPSFVEMIVSFDPADHTAYKVSLNLVNKGLESFLGSNWPDFTFQGTVLPEASV